MHCWPASHCSTSSVKLCPLVSRSFLQCPSESSKAFCLVFCEILGVPQKNSHDVHAVHWQRSAPNMMCQLSSLCYIYYQIIMHCSLSTRFWNRRKDIPPHLSALHTSISSRFGHKAPPCCGSWRTCLDLVLVPPPQVTVHSPHADQSSTLQSTGNVKLWWHIQEWIFAMIATMIIVIIFKSLWIVVLCWFDGWFWSWDMAW